MRKRGNFLLFSLLIVLSVLLCRVDIFLRKGQNRGPGRIINKSGKTIEEEWDRELLAGIRRFFLPQWKKEIFDQRRNIEMAGGIPEREIGAYLALARAYKKKGRYKEAKNA